MAENVSISRNNYPDPVTDFFALRRRAIELAQRLSGKEWTDYNEHDPGVTIIEQLCYAITDLGYRTSYDIRDLLAGQPDYTGENKDTFFTIDKVLPCRALTIDDWRKLILDQVEEVRNVWIDALPVSAEVPLGLYRIRFSVETDNFSGLKDEDVIEKVRKVFYLNRNLSEDINSIEVLGTKKIAFNAGIEIDEYYDSEETLGQILLNVDEFLTRPVPRYTILQLLDMGKTTEEIFSGPRMSNGFIMDDDLRPRMSKILYSQLIRVILDTTGVKSVYNFSISGADQQKLVYDLPDGFIPTLDEDMVMNCSHYVHLFKNRVKVVTEDQNVSNFYRGLKLSRPRSMMEALEEMQLKYYNVPHGRDRNLEYYKSIQYGFPNIYGIGQFGVPNGTELNDNGMPTNMSSPRRRGLAKQLKAFLLLFEQMLINYLEQLDNTAKLFTTVMDMRDTYFYAQPTTKKFPNLEPILLTKEDAQSGQIPMNISSGWMAEQAAMLNAIPKFGYKEGLDWIMDAMDPAFRRRDQFLDHLLARFHISLSTTAFSDADWYYLSDKTFEEYVLKTKTKFLRNAPQLCEMRGDACDMHDATSISWFETVVLLWLGLLPDEVLDPATPSKKPVLRLLAPPLYRQRIWMQRSEFETNVNSEYVRTVGGQISDEVVQKYFQPYDHPDHEIAYDADKYPEFYELLTEEQVYIDIDMLRNGYVVSNYRFGREENKGDLYTVVYSDPEETANQKKPNWKRIGVFKTKELVLKVVEGIAAYIRYINMETEGLHVVEHLLLRMPPSLSKKWLEFIDRDKKPIVISIDSFTTDAERDKIADAILKESNNRFRYIIHVDKLYHRYTFEILDEHRHPVARSITDYGDPAEVQKAVEKAQQYFQRLKHEGFDINRDTNSQMNHPYGELPPPSFYSGRMSVVLPAWTSRFGNPSFRTQLGQVLRGMAPAHLLVEQIFLAPLEMDQFEKLYLRWRQVRAKGDNVAASTAAELARFLYRHQANQNG